MANLEIIIKTLGAENLKGLKTGAEDAVQSLTGLNMASLTAAGGILAIGNAVKQAIEETQKYNLEMGDLALKMGTTTEEASRLIQVGDDLRISQQQIETAMKFAIKNGVEPTIDGLATLADQYNVLSGSVERGQFLLKYFGREGLEMGKLMEKGGDGIRKMSSEINSNLVVTTKAYQNSEKFFKSLDNLQESIDGVKIRLGNGLIPAMTLLVDKGMQANDWLNKWGMGWLFALNGIGDVANLLNEINDLFGGGVAIDTRVYESVVDSWQRGVDLAGEYNIRLGESNNLINQWRTEAADVLAKEMERVRDATVGAALATVDLSRNLKDLSSQGRKEAILDAIVEAMKAGGASPEAIKQVADQGSISLGLATEGTIKLAEILNQGLAEAFANGKEYSGNVLKLVDEIGKTTDPKKLDVIFQKFLNTEIPTGNAIPEGMGLPSNWQQGLDGVTTVASALKDNMGQVSANTQEVVKGFDTMTTNVKPQMDKMNTDLSTAAISMNKNFFVPVNAGLKLADDQLKSIHSRAVSLKQWADTHEITIRVNIVTNGSFPSVGALSGGSVSSGAGFGLSKMDAREMWTGGYADPNDVILVGENGPELFIPPRSGRVLSNGESSRAVGGGPIQVIFNFRDTTLDHEELYRSMLRVQDMAGGFA